MINLSYGDVIVPEDKREIIWGRIQDTVETLMKEQEEQKDGTGKKVVDEERSLSGWGLDSFLSCFESLLDNCQVSEDH